MSAFEPHHALGLVAVTCFVVHVAHLVRANEPESALWTCHVANLFVAAGLFVNSPTLNAIGLLWGLLGLPLWLQDMGFGRLAFAPTSLLTHVGGPLLGLAGASALGVPGGTWWKAVLALAALQLVTRLLASPRGNVNHAFAVWPAVEKHFTYRAYWAALLGVVVVYFIGLEWLLRAVL